MKTTVINLFAGPGAGKSTTAAMLFALMKLDGYKVEYVPEWCKLRAYQPKTFPSQATIFKEQCETMDLVFGKVGFIVTDSPLLSTIAYGSDPEDAIRWHRLFTPAINIFVKRVKEYQPSGRLQTEAQAQDKDIEVRKAYNLIGRTTFDLEVNGDQYAASNILRFIERFWS